MFKTSWEIPPAFLVILVIGAVVFFILPGLHLSPLGKAVGTVVAAVLAFAMARRVQQMQARRRETAAPQAD